MSHGKGSSVELIGGPLNGRIHELDGEALKMAGIPSVIAITDDEDDKPAYRYRYVIDPDDMTGHFDGVEDITW